LAFGFSCKYKKLKGQKIQKKKTFLLVLSEVEGWTILMFLKADSVLAF